MIKVILFIVLTAYNTYGAANGFYGESNEVIKSGIDDVSVDLSSPPIRPVQRQPPGCSMNLKPTRCGPARFKSTCQDENMKFNPIIRCAPKGIPIEPRVQLPLQVMPRPLPKQIPRPRQRQNKPAKRPAPRQGYTRQYYEGGYEKPEDEEPEEVDAEEDLEEEPESCPEEEDGDLLPEEEDDLEEDCPSKFPQRRPKIKKSEKCTGPGGLVLVKLLTEPSELKMVCASVRGRPAYVNTGNEERVAATLRKCLPGSNKALVGKWMGGSKIALVVSRQKGEVEKLKLSSGACLCQI